MRPRFRLLPLAVLMLTLVPAVGQCRKCSPTPWDEIGPFYRPNAPVRDTIGRGYELSGQVLSARDCSPLANARIEFWQTGPGGAYDDAHRATIFADRQGRYRLRTSYPPPYAQRPSHIHILVDAKGFEGLITQHYPKKGATRATLDLVLVPEPPAGGKVRNPLGQ